MKTPPDVFFGLSRWDDGIYIPVIQINDKSFWLMPDRFQEIDDEGNTEALLVVPEELKWLESVIMEYLVKRRNTNS